MDKVINMGIKDRNYLLNNLRIIYLIAVLQPGRFVYLRGVNSFY